jgi:anti-sigma B factor antagonist
MAGLDAGSATEMAFGLTEADDGSVTVTLSGELDITNVDRLASAVSPLIDHDPPTLVVDLGDVRFADSSAIALWVKWATNVSAIELRNPSPLLRRVIETMGLIETLNVT